MSNTDVDLTVDFMKEPKPIQVPMARIRTIQEAVHEIHEQDPHSAITPFYIRKLIKTGTVPAFTAGNKFLINMDVLLEFLANPKPIFQELKPYVPKPRPNYGVSGIRKIKE